MHITSVTSYIPGVDGAKNSLDGGCEFFHNQLVHTKDITGIYLMVSILFGDKEFQNNNPCHTIT